MHDLPTTLKGVVHGNTIAFDGELGLPDGKQVIVIVQAAEASRLPPGEGIRRSAGGWSDDVEGLEEYLEWNRRQRLQSRPEL
jgi:hypothetical protein